MSNDFDASEFLPKDTRLKGDLLESTGWDGHPVTISQIGRKSYEASGERGAEVKLQVFFSELGAYALECNSRQLKKLIELFGERTGAWIGRQVILISTDAGMFQGQPCKTITIKEAQRAAPPLVFTPPARQMPVQSAELPPLDDFPPDDPFADDPIDPEQMTLLENLCAQQGRNLVNTCQRMYALNPEKLTNSQAVDFITKLKQSAEKSSKQTVGAINR